VRDHLVHEVRDGVGHERRAHVVVHGAVHGLEAVAEGALGRRVVVAEEHLRAAEALGLLVRLEVVAAAHGVVLARELVVVRGQRGLVLGVEHRAVRVDDLDAARHAGVDVAEVEEVLGVLVRERLVHGVLRLEPGVARDEELGLVVVEAEVLAADLGVRRVVVVHARELAVLEVAGRLARVVLGARGAGLRDAGLELVDALVRAVGEVGHAERVVPVRGVRLVEVVGDALLHADDGHGDVAALGELEVARGARVGVHGGREGADVALAVRRDAGVLGRALGEAAAQPGRVLGLGRGRELAVLGLGALVGGAVVVALVRAGVRVGRHVAAHVGPGGLGAVVREPALHGEDLVALHVDHGPEHVLDDAVGAAAVVVEAAALALGLARLVERAAVARRLERALVEQELGHVDGVLVVRDHLPHERLHLRAQGRLHVEVHGAVHGAQAVAKVAELGVGAHERVHARGGVRVGLEAVGAALFVEGRGRLVVVGRERGLVLLREGHAVFAEDLDAAAHARVDVAEVEEVRGRVLGDREVHLVGVLGPLVRGEEEVGLVDVEAKVLAADVDAVVVAADELAVLEVHGRLAREVVGAGGRGARGRDARLELVDAVVGAVGQVREAQRVVPVGRDALVEEVGLARHQADGRVGRVAALLDGVVAGRARERVDRHGEGADVTGAVVGGTYVLGRPGEPEGEREQDAQHRAVNIR